MRTKQLHGGLIMVAAMLFCLAGCKKDEGEKITLGTQFEKAVSIQKTYLGENNTVCWSAGDEVKVNETVYSVSAEGIEVTEADNYYAVYPATDGNSVDENGGMVTLPASQTYTLENGKQVLNGPMAARLDDKSGMLYFKNLYSLLKVTVSADDKDFTVSSITVTATDDNARALAGTYDFSFRGATAEDPNTAPTVGDIASGSSKVTLINIAVKVSAGEDKDFYLVVHPLTTAQNLTVKVYGVLNGNTVVYTHTTAVTHSLSRSRIGGLAINLQQLQPDHDFVDLGLSVLWATCNIGSEFTENPGYWFAWGETVNKNDYSHLTYKFGSDTNNPSKYNSTDNKNVLDLEDDAAYVNWGGNWRMPTKAEWEELMSKCIWTWTENYEGHSGVNGFVIAGHGQQIFLPASGYREGTEDRFVGQHGNYWSASLRSDMTKYAYSMDFFVPGLHVPSSFIDEKDLRYISHTVRPVMPNPNYQPQSN